MLVRLSADNRLTLPAETLDAVAGADVFDLRLEAGRIVLTPVREAPGDSVRLKLADLGLNEADIDAAVDWARSSRVPVAGGAE